VHNILSYIKIPWLIFTIAVFTLLIKLSLWQIDRATEKEQRLVRISSFKQQAALSLNDLLLLEKNNNENINDFPIKLKGEFENDILFLLDNQTNNGQLGYRVLQVFNTDNHAVLVNLGWVLGSINRQELPKISTIKGQHDLRGNIRIIDVGIQLIEQDFTDKKWPLRVQQIELDKFSTLIKQKLLPFVVYLDTKESIGYKKNWQPIVMPPEKHRAYAFQWLSLAIAWLMLMVWAAVKMKADVVKPINNKTDAQ
jgi:surfeit locus 1 family protein